MGSNDKCTTCGKLASQGGCSCLFVARASETAKQRDELLAACKRLLESCEHVQGNLSYCMGCDFAYRDGEEHDDDCMFVEARAAIAKAEKGQEDGGT